MSISSPLSMHGLSLSRLAKFSLAVALPFAAISCDVPNDPAQDSSEEPAKKEHHHHGESHATSDGGDEGSGDGDASAKQSHEAEKHESGKHESEKHESQKKDGDHGDPSSSSSDRSKESAPNSNVPSGVQWYMTLHDAGARDPVTGQESVLGFGADGAPAGGVLTKVPDADGELQDLRGMLPLTDGTLLVISAWKKNTQILHFGVPASDARRPFIGVFARSDDNNQLLIHPYAMAIAPDGSILVSNQDSNTVTRYGAPNTANAGQPLTPSGAVDAGTKSAGLVVPSHEMNKHGVKEVRGIAVTAAGTLLVADRGKGEVSAWNLESGERLRVLASKNDGIETPIQLLIAPDGNTLYISDNKRNEVFRLQLPDGKPSVFIGEDAGIDATSSLAIHDGYLYVGSRKAREILRFRLNDGVGDEKPFIANLSDNPEFFMVNPAEAKP
jgi:hypothetical protein